MNFSTLLARYQEQKEGAVLWTQNSSTNREQEDSV